MKKELSRPPSGQYSGKETLLNDPIRDIGYPLSFKRYRCHRSLSFLRYTSRVTIDRFGLTPSLQQALLDMDFHRPMVLPKRTL